MQATSAPSAGQSITRVQSIQHASLLRPALLAIVLPLIISGCDLVQPPLVKACEELVKKRLTSPSGYKRASYSESEENLSIEDWMTISRQSDKTGTEDAFKLEERRMRETKAAPKKFSVFLTYDAPNAFGTEIRNISMCEYYSKDGSGKPKPSDYNNIKVDGKDEFQWLLRNINP